MAEFLKGYFKKMSQAQVKGVVLGTAQLGMQYGIANASGQPQQKVATEIIREAWESGIHELDTAQGYGNSESVIGEALTALGIENEMKITSKVHLSKGLPSFGDFKNLICQSLERLKVSKLFGLMLHSEDLLQLWNKGLHESLEALKKEGIVEHTGVSIYSPEKALEALNLPGIDFIQVPTNLLDRRFENANVFRQAEEVGKKVYIRSVYLQGLLVLPKEKLPEKMAYIIPVLERLDEICQDLNMTRQELALGYIKTALPSAKLILGVETPAQMKKNVEGWLRNYPASLTALIQEEFSQVSDRITQPLQWPMKFWPS